MLAWRFAIISTDVPLPEGKLRKEQKRSFVTIEQRISVYVHGDEVDDTQRGSRAGGRGRGKEERGKGKYASKRGRLEKKERGTRYYFLCTVLAASMYLISPEPRFSHLQNANYNANFSMRMKRTVSISINSDSLPFPGP